MSFGMKGPKPTPPADPKVAEKEQETKLEKARDLRARALKEATALDAQFIRKTGLKY
jgi:hypothetical protein